MKYVTANTEAVEIDLSGTYSDLVLIRKGLVDEFAEIERMLAEELKTNTNLFKKKFKEENQNMTYEFKK